MHFKYNVSQMQVFKPMWKFYLVGKKGYFEHLYRHSNRYWIKGPLETKSIIQPPSLSEFSGSWRPPSPSEFPIPSVVGVWIFSGTTQWLLWQPVTPFCGFNLKHWSIGYCITTLLVFDYSEFQEFLLNTLQSRKFLVKSDFWEKCT